LLINNSVYHRRNLCLPRLYSFDPHHADDEDWPASRLTAILIAIARRYRISHDPHCHPFLPPEAVATEEGEGRSDCKMCSAAVLVLRMLR
jgi:hypothetical protein